MIISHEHQFIFLKTRKTAGTSVELALRQLCGPDDIIAPIGDAEERRQQALHYRGRASALRAHAGVARARLSRRGGVVVFQIWLRPQSLGPAGVVVSLQAEVEAGAAELRVLHGEPRSRLCRQLPARGCNYQPRPPSPSISSAATRSWKRISTRRSNAPASGGALRSRAPTSPRTRTSPATTGAITRPGRGRWSPSGISPRSRFWATGIEGSALPGHGTMPRAKAKVVGPGGLEPPTRRL